MMALAGEYKVVCGDKRIAQREAQGIRDTSRGRLRETILSSKLALSLSSQLQVLIRPMLQSETASHWIWADATALP